MILAECLCEVLLSSLEPFLWSGREGKEKITRFLKRNSDLEVGEYGVELVSFGRMASVLFFHF